jgi:hypothetical protein
MAPRVNFLEKMPKDVIYNIHSFCDAKTHNRLSETSPRVQAIFDQERENLSIQVPEDHKIWNEDRKIPVAPVLLTNLLKRFPNIRSLSVADFHQCHKEILIPFLKFLAQNFPENLSTVRLSEIEGRWGCGMPYALTQNLFRSLGHPQIKNLTISSNPHGNSCITKALLILTFQRYPNLNSFSFSGQKYNETPTLEIPLSICKNLEKVELNDMVKIGEETTKEIAGCSKLKELSINEIKIDPGPLERFLCSNHGLNLKILNLQETPCLLTDETLHLATKNLPDLESFNSEQVNQFSDDGLLILAKTCKKLGCLTLCFAHITDNGMQKFSACAPQLKTLSTRNMWRITNKGIDALTSNCKELVFLNFRGLKHFNPAFLSSLVINCSNLQHLSIEWSCSQEITVECLKEFMLAVKSLKSLKVRRCDGIRDISLREHIQ